MHSSTAGRLQQAGLGTIEQVFEDLAQARPEDALVDAGNLIESLIGNQDLADQQWLVLLFGLDEAVQSHARVHVERYLLARRQGGGAHRKHWGNVRSHWALLLEAYGELITQFGEDRNTELSPALLAELAVRTIRAGAQRAKWDAFRHGPMDHAIWGRLNQAYRLAVRAGISHRNVRLRANRATETSVEREYMRAVALHSVGMDQLDCERLELASRIIHYALPYLELSPTPSLASLHWVDTAFSLPPARLVKTPRNATLPRFFSGMVAVPSLEELLEMVLVGDLPAVLQSAAATPGLVASVLSHIIKAWSSQPAVRRYRRHPMPGQLLVIDGLQRFVSSLAGEGADVVPQAWEVKDASLQGVGLVGQLDDDQEVLNVGTLVGMHSTDGDRWRVGAVRRIWRASERQGQVGVELLGGTPAAATADDGSVEVRILLLEQIQRGQPVRVVVPIPGPRANVPLYLLRDGNTIKLSPLTTLEYGADFEIRVYLYAA